MKVFINELATTNFRILMTTCLFALTIVVLLTGVVLNRDLSKYQWLVTTIFGAEAVFAGLDVTQYIGKRKTDTTYMSSKPDVNVQQADTITAQGDVNVSTAAAVPTSPQPPAAPQDQPLVVG